jgi:hypothetical protein
LLGFFERLDATPIMRRFQRSVASGEISWEELIFFAMLGIAAAPALGDPDEAECFDLAYSRSNPFSRNTVSDEIRLRDRQPLDVVTAVAGKFDFDTIKDSAGRQRQNAVGWRLQHLNKISRPLTADPIAPNGFAVG